MSEDREAELIESSAEFAEQMGRKYFEHRLGRIEKRTQSPIERVMLAMFIAFEFALRPPPLWVSEDDYEWPGEVAGPPVVNLFVQAKVGQFRADFLLREPCERGVRFTAIECDGHDYHERTKQQAERDRSRDRWMTANDIFVMRFTGAEIWRDPASCLAEAVNAAKVRDLGEELWPRAVWRMPRRNA